MQTQTIKQLKVFISYSWTTEEHEEWVLNLATRLRENGVDIILDKWDLKDGQDIYAFMESMVRAEETDKVLVICDKGYKERANLRKGGVGTETQIISPQIYEDVKQEKFIPIIAERNEVGEAYIPTYMSTRKYIDLSSPDNFETAYEALLRNLYERPQYRKPALGNAPSFIFEDDIQHFKTANINKQLQDAFVRNPVRAGSLIREFEDAFFEHLEQFKIQEYEKELDEVILENIHNMLPLRDDFINFLESISRYQVQVDVDHIIRFFEKIMSFIDGIHDHFKFLIYELFLYTIMILLEHEQFEAASQLLHNHYAYNMPNTGRLVHERYDHFNRYVDILDETRNHRLQLNRVSITADLMIQRATQKYSRQKIVETDLLLHYISKMENIGWGWFPRTYVYNSYYPMEIMQRLILKRHFDKVKVLFKADTPTDLQEKMDNAPRDRGYSSYWESIPLITSYINTKEIGKL
ncbi:SEFIR domain-containing protein [Bacillus cereus]|uniref:SEFIR domain-containing protein n=1 Tax=Bacillus cereus TaxID=1396 RepID=UPI002A14E834|nr:TIR domain-containing protein [Bacillus cereus]